MEYVIKQLKSFSAWVNGLRDGTARAMIDKRLENARKGNFGQHRRVKDGLWEMKLDYGPGYRLYYGRKGQFVYVVVGGGTKGTQTRDIDLAFAKWVDVKEGQYGQF